MSNSESVWLALALAVALALAHLAAPALRRQRLIPAPALASFAGGVSVAYVFLHLLPELAEGNEGVGEALQDVVEPTPLLDLAIFAVALGGFTALYGLERLARHRGERSGHSAVGPLFALHLGTFAVYNALILYTMPLRLRTGVDFALMFAAAMALHFVLTDRGLSEHYPRRFARYGRPVLVAALLAGWVAAAVAAPVHTVTVSLLTALLGGFVLLNVFKEEIPEDRESRFPWFLGGVALYGGLLALVTAASAS